MKKIFLLIFTSLVSISTCYSQDLHKLIKSGDDINYLFNGYMSPFANGMGKALNSGWYNSAEIHGLLGFDITVGASLAMAPDDAKSFTIYQKDLHTLNLNGKESMEAPTFFADDDAEGVKLYTGVPGLLNIETLTTPAGVGMALAASVAPQLSLGIGFDMELQARFLPNISIGDMGEVGLWGLGLRYDVLEQIPVAEFIPFLHISANIAYSELGSKIAVESSDLGSGDFETTVSSMTTNLAVSGDFPFITLYGSVGYGWNSTDMKLKGEYTVLEVQGVKTKINDPVDFSSDISDLRYTAGLKLKMGFIHFFGDYTKDGEYNVINTGISISTNFL